VQVTTIIVIAKKQMKPPKCINCQSNHPADIEIVRFIKKFKKITLLQTQETIQN